MILRNTNYTFTADFEQVTARPIYNSNTAITIGGIIKSQIDSVRLRITSQIRILQSDIASLENIINDFTLPIYYTPKTSLYNRTTIEEIEVVMTADPVIDQTIFQDDKIFYITFEFEEVKTG